MRFATLCSICAAASIVKADVEFVSPAAGASIAAGTVTITWKDSGTSPALSALTSYTMNLYSGSNTAPKDLGAIKAAGTAFSGTSVSVTIAPTLGGNGTNAYFIGMTSVATAGGQVINYSDRFTLTGMTGTFDATTEAANEAISGTSGPDTENQVASAAGTATGTTATTATVDAAAVAAAAAAATQTGEFTVAYSLQTGPVRYAPMPSPPGTSITATNTAPLFPTSAATIATDFLSAASVTMTYSASNTYSVASHTNTAAAASGPAGDMQRFLERWKD